MKVSSNKAAQHAALLQRAMQAHQKGQFDVARAHYRRLLTLVPRHADALHLLGVLEAHQGQHAQAAALIGRAIAVHPNEAMFHNNLGNVSVERGDFADAEARYRQALVLEPDRPDAMSNLGALLSQSGRRDEALKLLGRVVELAPGLTQARHNLANHYFREGRLKEAMEVCVEAQIVAPRSPELRHVLGKVYASLGQNDKAAELYRLWLEDDPDNAEAKFHLTACTGEDVPDRAPDGYVADTFDNFAASFDAKLSQLAYRAPEFVAEAVARHAGEPAHRHDVLDAGCGTGLCGPLLKPWARRLVGVDLSQGMLDRAQPRGVYDELVCAELVAFLNSRPASCSVLVSADTLCYFGMLTGFASAARRALRDGGVLAFTVEAHEDGPGAPDFILHAHGRYSHRRAYVEAALSGAGLAPLEMQPVVLRNEAGKPVEGCLVCARAGLTEPTPTPL